MLKHKKGEYITHIKHNKLKSAILLSLTACTLCTFNQPASAYIGIGGGALLGLVTTDISPDGYTYNINATDPIAIGQAVDAEGNYSIAFGTGTTALGDYSIATGYYTTATKDYSIAYGTNTHATAKYATAFGTDASASGSGAIAAGASATAQGDYSAAYGENVTANGDYSIATGYYAQASKVNSIAIGSSSDSNNPATTNTFADAEDAIAIGTGTQATGTASISMGLKNDVEGVNSAAIGSNNTIKKQNTFVLGNSITASQDNSVILGNGSADKAAVAVPNITIGSTTYAVAGTSPVGVVSVGSTGSERQIINVAAGEVSADSTDAVNGSQLYEVEQAVDGINGANGMTTTDGNGNTTTVSPTGMTTSNGTTTTNVNAGSITFTNSSGATGPSMTSTGIDAGGDKITSVAAGSTASGSTDAVNGSQLNTLGGSVASDLGGGSTYDSATGKVTAPSYAINDGSGTTVSTATNVGDAITDLNSYVNKGVTFKDSNTGSYTATPGSTVTIKGDSNITASVSSTGVVDVAISATPTFTSVTAGSTKIDGTTNTITGLSNTSWDGTKTSGYSESRAATEGELEDLTSSIATNGTSTSDSNGNTTTVAGNGMTTTDGKGDTTTVSPTGMTTSNGTTTTNVNAGSITFTDSTGTKTGPSVTSTGIDAGGDKITSVAAGSTASGSTDAVNGSQLNTLGGSVASDLGGGSTYDSATGKVTAPSYAINDGSGTTVSTATNVGDAITDLNSYVNKGVTFKDSNTGSYTATPGSTVTIKGDSNITASVSSTGVVDVAISATPTFTSVTAGSTKIDGTTNTITGLSNTSWDGTKTSGYSESRAATEGELEDLTSSIATNGTSTSDSNGNTTTVTGGGVTTTDGKGDTTTVSPGSIITTDGNGSTTMNGSGLTTGTGDNAIDINGTNGTITAGKITVDGVKGTIDGLTNTSWDPTNITSGQAATENQVKSAEEAATTTVSAGKNIKVTKTQDTTDDHYNYDVALADIITLGTTGSTSAVTINGTAGTITTGSVVISGGTTNTITGLSNTSWNGSTYVSGRAATEDELYQLESGLTTGGLTTSDGKGNSTAVTATGVSTTDSKNNTTSLTSTGVSTSDNKGNTASVTTSGVSTTNSDGTTDVSGSGMTVTDTSGNKTTVSSTGVSTGNVSINGNTGTNTANTITGLSNTTWSGTSTDGYSAGRAATEGELSDAIGSISDTVNEGWNAQVDGKTVNNIKSGSSQNFESGDNITLTDDNGAIKVSTKSDVSFSKVTVNNVVIDSDGINAGNQKITNVAAGDVSSSSTDAVNGSQLYSVEQSVTTQGDEINSLGRDINRLGDRVDKVGAGAAALAGLRQPEFDPDDKLGFAVGYGHYNGQGAVAVGTFYSPTENTTIGFGYEAGNGENMWNLGLSFKLGSGHNTTSRVAMSREINDLRSQNNQILQDNKEIKDHDAKLEQDNEEMKQEIEQLKQKVGM